MSMFARELDLSTFYFDPSADYAAKERGERVKYVRKVMLRYSRDQFRRRHNISASSVYNWESGRGIGIGERAAYTLSQMFKEDGVRCHMLWILYGLGKPPESYKK